MDQEKYYYIACPYSGTEEEKKYRQDLCLKVAAKFLKQSIPVFAPVPYINEIVDLLGLSDISERRDLVMPYLLNFLSLSKGMIILTIPGWEDSQGIKQEIEFCQENNLPIYKIDPDSIFSSSRLESLLT